MVDIKQTINSANSGRNADTDLSDIDIGCNICNTANNRLLNFLFAALSTESLVRNLFLFR